MRIFVITLSVILIITSDIYASGAFPLYDDSTILIGSNTTYTIKNKETLIELARKYDVGYNEIIAANNGIDPWIPKEGTEIVIPTRWILPEIVDEFPDIALGFGIEASSGFIHQQQRRRGLKRPRYGHFLLHPARQFLHRFVHTLCLET